MYCFRLHLKWDLERLQLPMNIFGAPFGLGIRYKQDTQNEKNLLRLLLPKFKIVVNTLLVSYSCVFISNVVYSISCMFVILVFDDGDITTLRRTALCLKSGRHFNESETLDQLPLTHPEHFGNPVVGGRRGRRSRQLK